MRCLLLCLSLSVFFCNGCTHFQLKRNTIKQARTLEDIYQQQVLDNLAKFVHNPNSLPHFAFPKEGATTAENTGRMTSVINWMKSGFNMATLTVEGSAKDTGSWTMDPIRDPHKLALMRCAYQKALSACGIGEMSHDCPNCPARFYDFYKNHSHSGENERCLDCGVCWIQWGKWKDLPKNCKCLPVGHYCGTYVWIRPEHQEHLTRLTLMIMDFALFEPEADPVNTKRVTLYVGPKGTPTTREKAVQIIEQDVAATEDLTSTQSKGGKDNKLISGKGLQEVPSVRTKLGEPQLNILQLQQRLRALGGALR